MIRSIMEIAPKQVEGVTEFCICNKCKKTFKAEKTLMKRCDNISFQGILNVKGITKGRHTWYLMSPCCKQVHLFSFDFSTEEKI